MIIKRIKRELDKGNTIYDLPLRVTYYNRQMNEDEESLQKYFEKLISCQEKWTYIEGYNDKIRNIDAFQKLLEDSKESKFDIVLIKTSLLIPFLRLDGNYLRVNYRDGLVSLYKTKKKLIDIPKNNDDIELEVTFVVLDKYIK